MIYEKQLIGSVEGLVWPTEATEAYNGCKFTIFRGYLVKNGLKFIGYFYGTD